MEKLVVLTMFYGGKMQRMLDSSVTHLVTMDASGVGHLHGTCACMRVYKIYAVVPQPVAELAKCYNLFHLGY